MGNLQCGEIPGAYLTNAFLRLERDIKGGALG